MTLLDKLKALHEIEDRLEGWHGEFIAAVWAQTGSGTDDAFLSNGQAATLRHLFDKHIGEKNK